MKSGGEADDRGTLTGGCLIAFASAMLTGLMLFINGSFVWALLAVFVKSGPSWASKPEFMQFILFIVPVFLVVPEWIMIDYVRSKVGHRGKN
jgi:hypothetical protein